MKTARTPELVKKKSTGDRTIVSLTTCYKFMEAGHV